MPLSKLLLTPIAIAALVLITAPAQAQHGPNSAAACTGKVAAHSVRPATAVRTTTVVRTPTAVRASTAVRTSVTVRKPAVVRTTSAVVYIPATTSSRVVVAPVRTWESVYVFRPRFNLGPGLWAGFPVAYNPSFYGSSVVVGSSPYSAVAVTSGPVSVAPVAAGGLTFEVAPNFARVYVDGEYVGRAADFAAISTPLILTPGSHRVKIKADDYHTMTFNTEIFPGQILPYQAVMQSKKI